MKEITTKLILEVALIMESMPKDFESEGQQQKWIMENLGNVLFAELDAATVVHENAKRVQIMVNGHLKRAR